MDGSASYSSVLQVGIRIPLEKACEAPQPKKQQPAHGPVGLGHRQRHARMSTLMKNFLSTLDPGQKDRLRENLVQAPSSLAVTALRRLLD
jgi:hypothetical protein